MLKSITPAGPSQSNLSFVTAVSSGAPLSFQSGMSSFSALGSITAPDRMWAPTSEPFSSTADGEIRLTAVSAGSPPPGPQARRRR